MTKSAMLPSTHAANTVSSEVTDYAPGLLIGEKYRLLRFLGEGAQGSVWLAENTALCAEVAVKIVHADATDSGPTLRLEKEARMAARLGHPGVVRVFDLGRTVSGDAFVVMEFLQGENLGERLTTCGRMEPIEAVRTLLPIADVLHVAHDAGIVHRDIKPENVFLAKNGATVQPKLLDFGIAKRPGASEPVITDVGALVGSPAYVSPEQAHCREDVGLAADIWSFCVVLYECLTGALPFAADNYGELFRQIEHEPPPSILSLGVADVELWAIVRRGLAKSPSDRWPDMQSLGRALACWLKARGVQDDISGIRLDARWLARARNDTAGARDAFEPPSFVRRARTRENDDGPLSRGRLPKRRPTSLWLVLGGLALLPLGVAAYLMRPSMTTAVLAAPSIEARKSSAAVSPEVLGIAATPEPPALGELTTRPQPAASLLAETSPTPEVLPASERAAKVPRSLQRATRVPAEGARPTASSAASASGTAPASTVARREVTFDLLEPY